MSARIPRILIGILSAAGLLGIAPGCSMLMNGFGSTDDVSITSTPPGMNVRIARVAPPLPDLALDFGPELRTPCRIALPRDSAYTATLSKPGYTTAVASIATVNSSWYYANAFIPLGCLVLMPLDSLFGTGAVLAPQDIRLQMEAATAPQLSYGRETPSVGSTLDLAIGWPSGPRADYLVLAMSAPPPADLEAGALEQFAAGAAIPDNWGLTLSGMTGTMDSRGAALVQLQIPDDPGLVGKALFFVCVGLGDDRDAFSSDTCELVICCDPSSRPPLVSQLSRVPYRGTEHGVLLRARFLQRAAHEDP